MNPNNNDIVNHGNPPQQPQSTQPIYAESKSSKIIRETGTVVAGVGLLASLIAVVKGIFKK